MVDFGSDVSTFPDLDPTFALITGFRVVGEALARRLITPYGMLPGDRDYGFDVRSLLNEGMTPANLYVWQRMIAAECEKDERVFTVDVTLTSTDRDTLRITINAQTAQGPFRLVLEVTAVTLKILEVTP